MNIHAAQGMGSCWEREREMKREREMEREREMMRERERARV